MIVVTGAAGFVGKNLVKYLNEKGYENIILVDTLSKKNYFKNLLGLKYCDFLNFEKGLEYLKNSISQSEIEVIFHIGANADVLVEDCNLMMEMNFEHSKFWFHIAKERNIPFLYASSSAIYGNSNCFKVLRDCERSHNEYAFSKLAFDNYIRFQLLNNKNNINRILGFRFFNVFGEGEYHKGKNASLPYRFFEFIKDKGYIDLFDADIRRDYVYVNDVCEVLYYAWKNNVKSGIYNLGSGNAISHEKLASIIIETLIERKIIKKNKNYIKKIPMPENLKTRFQFYTIAEELPHWIKHFTKNNEIKIKSYINKLITRFYNVNSF